MLSTSDDEKFRAGRHYCVVWNRFADTVVLYGISFMFSAAVQVLKRVRR